ncbi:MAG: PSD1 and planctomycete cytochrome C domain-containing protein [Planctomycetaceae bacterium]
MESHADDRRFEQSAPGLGRVPVLFAALLSLAAPPLADGAEEINFVRQIRPLLSDHCFTCHGPDASNRKGDLRLDVREGVFGKSDDQVIVSPGHSSRSELFRRITASDPTERMPPAESHKPLSAEQIELIRRWIDEGAAWSGHWAFESPVLPKGAAGKSLAMIIDELVLARLKQERLSFSPEADRATLLRRLSLDLTGLPPSIAEIDSFVDDPRPQAYDDAVERLLRSPHYGEHWGRFWLDAARYADSDGYEKDKPRLAWSYRDWVIRAFNQDLPYDQFVIEQIAGDLLPHPTQDQRVATGFLRNAMTNEEGGADPEQFRMEAMFDRMDAIGKSVLGLTIQCAQCHDHKFDPISQQEYYGLFAFLNNCHEASIAVLTPEELQLRGRVLGEIRRIERQRQASCADWPRQLESWENSNPGDRARWTVATSNDDHSAGGHPMLHLSDGSYMLQGYAPVKATTTLHFKVASHAITAFRLEQLNDPGLPCGGPGRSFKGVAALTEFKARVWPNGHYDQGRSVVFRTALANLNPPERELDSAFDDRTGTRRVTGPVGFAIDDDPKTAWVSDLGPGRRNAPSEAIFVAESPISFPNTEELEVEVQLVQNHGGWNSDANQAQSFGRFRISTTDDEGPFAAPLPCDVQTVLGIAKDCRTDSQSATLFSYWRTTRSEWSAANARIEELWAGHPEGSSQLVLEERSEPRVTRLLDRGSFLKPLEVVTPATPGFLHALSEPRSVGEFASSSRTPPRLALARWLVDRRSPTTARSLVNRIWQAYFGTGLVSTSEDLGSQSEAPSHPELLDALAVTLMDGGWRIKELHRQIVRSEVYRQSSRVDPHLLVVDPANRLLGRGARFRVDAEMVRDMALAASGLLNPAIGGPSVYPPAPEFLFQPPTSYGPKDWNTDTGSGRFRRGLYTFRFRSIPYPAMQAFDGTTGDFSCVRRTRSNTPLQALTTLNEPVFLQCAGALAERTLRDGGSTDEERLHYACRRCLGRAPRAEECQVLARLVAQELSYFEEHPGDAEKLNRSTSVTADESIKTGELAAWTIVARTLFNLDEAITKE